MDRTSDDKLTDALSTWLPSARRRIDNLNLTPRVEEIGRVEQIGDGIATVSGLPETRLDEILLLPGDLPALATTLDRGNIGCILLGDADHVRAGDRVHGTGAIVRVPVGDGLLGRVVDPLGRPLDDGPAIESHDFKPIETAAPGIMDRDLVTEPLNTGVTVIDAMFPLGRGQRELIIGDRSTGKTAIAVDTIINQRSSDVISVYIAVGQKSSNVRQVIEAVREHGAFDRCIFVVAAADDPPGLQWLAPYAGFTIAEHFRDRGDHALAVIDDLSKHAATHRELSLLLRQPPGREAFPGDIFYVHSRLLERAAKLSKERGGGSLSALPIATTQAGNLSAYIPTNLISITDGQIYLDKTLFNQGHKPAVDVGRSVSRVGGKTQTPAMRKLAESLRLDYAQFLELEVFTRFGAMVDQRTRRTIEHGRRIRALLTQPQYQPLRQAVQVAELLALSEGVLDSLPLDRIATFKARLPSWLDARVPAALNRIEKTGELDEDSRSALGSARCATSPPRWHRRQPTRKTGRGQCHERASGRREKPGCTAFASCMASLTPCARWLRRERNRRSRRLRASAATPMSSAPPWPKPPACCRRMSRSPRHSRAALPRESCCSLPSTVSRVASTRPCLTRLKPAARTGTRFCSWSANAGRWRRANAASTWRGRSPWPLNPAQS